MNKYVLQFIGTMRDHGLQPPDVINEGVFHRFPGISKKHNNKAGWCILFEEGVRGCFGDFSSNLNKPWKAKQEIQYSKLQLDETQRRVDYLNKKNKFEIEQKYRLAAKKARNVWNDAKPASNDYPYLKNKGINAKGVKLYKNNLVIPIYFWGKLQSIQFIDMNGGKRFLKRGRLSGGYFKIGVVKPSEPVCIAEGFATGKTIYQATGYTVFIAFHSGNLDAVAKSVRKKYPTISVTICADDDVNTLGNPGVTHAKAAAKHVNARVSLPQFGVNRPEKASDFNDMAMCLGLESVAKVIKRGALHAFK